MSPLRDALASYVTMRRGFGYKLRTQEYLLISFVAFMEARNAIIVTNKLALDWTTCTARPVTWPTRLSAVRSFARHLSCTEPRTQIPPTGILGKPQRRAPHIYTQQELDRLLEAMLELPPAKRLRRWSYYCLFGLLSVTGLRISEALTLKRDDVDLEEGILTIRETKFGKSRFVPIHPSTITVLTDYAARRDARQIPESPSGRAIRSRRVGY